MTKQFLLGVEVGAVATLCVTVALTIAWIVSLMHRHGPAQERKDRDKRWSGPR